MVKDTRKRRPNGEGYLYQTPDGRYRGSIRITGDDGGYRRLYVSGKTADEARRKLATLRTQLDTGHVPTAGARLTVSDHLARWLDDARSTMRASTWRGHDGNVRRYIVPALGRIPLVKLTPQNVESMTNGMIPPRGRLSRSTARAARTTLRLALAEAVRHGLVSRNVAAIAKPPKVTRPQPRYLSAEEARLVLADDGEHAQLFAVALATGLRQGELLGLTWTDVDLEAGQLTVRRSMARDWSGGWSLAEPKTDESRRSLALSRHAADALRRQRVRQAEARLAAGSAWQDRDGLCFTDEAGRALIGSRVTKVWARTLRTIGVHHVPFHGARHTYATLSLAAGVPLKVVSENLGHSTITITADIYASVTPDLKRDAAAAIDRALGGAS